MGERGDTMVTRASFALIGAIAGIAIWVLFEVLPDVVTNARLVLFVAAGGTAFFGVLLALMGPVRLSAAAIAATLLSAATTVLLVWASLRYDSAEQFLETGHHVFAYIFILIITVPFIAAGLVERDGWRRYALLFDNAWIVVVRYAAAGLFVAVVWGVVTLSDALLGLVGINVIDWLLDIQPLPYLLSGLAFGLGLAIVHELSDVVSPFLIIQLLRVLLPVVLVVLSIFILALPFRGLSGLFGGFSAAATLAGVAFGAITLITTAMHREDAMAVEGGVMLTATKALALLVFVPAVLAVFAIWVRCVQYGLTPDRIAAMVAAVIIAVYALGYGVSVLMRGRWAMRLRRMNRWMALVTVGVAALWLSPILNAERMTVWSQLNRAAAGTPLDGLALYEMAHDWGRAGERGLARIEALPGRSDQAELARAVSMARAAPSKWSYERDLNGKGIGLLGDLVAILPAGTTVPPGAFDQLGERDRRQIHKACLRRVAGGYPACVVVFADYDPQQEGRQAIGLFETSPGRVQVMTFTLRGDALMRRGGVGQVDGTAGLLLGPEAIVDLHEGRFAVVPYTRNALEVGGVQLIPQN